ADVSDEELRSQVAAEFSRPYDLERGPCFRPHLWRRTADDHILMVAAHHTVMDLAAMTTLQDELWTVYRGLVDGAAVELPALAADYADFVRWQADRLAGEEGERQGKWWAERLGQAPAVLHLPTDRARPPLQSLRGGTVPFVLDAEVTAGVAALAREERSSTFRVLLAAFFVLLHRYTEQTDILVGSPASGQTEPRFGPMVGHCVNMLAIRADLSGGPTFRSLLRSVNDQALQAIANQDFPFPLLVERLQPARDASRSPLFQVAFSFQRSDIAELPNFIIAVPPREGFARAGLAFEPFPVPQQNGQFDLALWMARPAANLIGELKYAADLFDHSTVNRAVGHLRTLLAGIVANPDQRVADLPLLVADERRQVVVEWNRTAHGFAEDRCMHELFEAQADRAPGAVAAVFDQRSATYADVEAEANRLAHLLRELGTGPGRLVAVYLDRSLEIPAALLGILKSGGGYVPLDTTHPRARIELILSSLPVSIIVTQHRHLAALQALDVANLRHLVAMDDDESGSDGSSGPLTVWTAAHRRARPSSRPAALAAPTDTAYIIFTSGSTGTPKGVEVQHRPALNLIQWVNDTFEIGPADRLLMVTSLCFDLSVYDIFGVLGAGGSLQLASVDDLRDPTRLVRLLLEQPITFWDSAPPALGQLVPFLPAHAADRPLRLVFLSGDWIPVPLPDQIRAVFPAAEMVSLGGATEATIWSNVYRIGAVEPHWVSIPYGKPIWNARYYVLDPQGAPCPIGVPGDLFIGGRCLAVGYVNDPTLTNSKFVPDPFDEAEASRLYRTGDRARFFADGNIEFLGRKDFQVKIRGYRIELGEIEAVLRQHDRVAECIVLARDDAGPDRYLVGYVVPARGAAPPTAELKGLLRERLPAYMVPAHLVLLDRMPMTPNGKLDRRALPAPQHVRDVTEAYVEPRTELERAVADIWTSILPVDRVGVDDNFFDLGGHSLQSVEIVLRLEQLVGRTVPLSILLQAPTVAELAAAVSGPGDGSLVVPLRAGAREPPLVLFHPAGGDLLAYHDLVERLADRRVVGVQSRTLAGERDEFDTLDVMADAYAAALRDRIEDGPWHLAGWSMGGVLAHAVAARLEAAGQRVSQVTLFDAALIGEVPGAAATLSYRLGAAFGPLASAVAAADPHELEEAVDLLLAMPADQRGPAAIAWTRAAGFPALDDEWLLARQVALTRRHEELLRAHRAPVIRAPIGAWWANGSLLSEQPPADWSRRTSGLVRSETVPGNHYTIMRPPVVDLLAAALVTRPA
ncbi:MAG: amino acid adenylation domain-containing protein, partial [Actinomycetota bacterium]|nr:amino acid adenylation domain-containing protein [Actinomycetota bacterium]